MAKLTSSSPRNQFSNEADRVFDAYERVVFLVGDEQWIDLYALLGVSPNQSHHELEEAIVSCGADLVLSDFGRSSTERAVLTRRYIDDFRLVLLDKARRQRYDALLQRHLRGDKTATSYESWRHSELELTLAQRLKRRSQTWWARVRQNVQETPYF